MARLNNNGGIVPTQTFQMQKRNSGCTRMESDIAAGAAAAPAVMQGRNSVASINSGYNEMTQGISNNNNPKSQTRVVGGPG